ncbi:hypothetical protein LTR37_017979 [Vermiconidia calcicola]|uniref:Uncharacterized protein n=1 Tax=Vermiconidia calcicola TaxID=1690605 RepID=A0ACC3MJG2_9PEZI|nr:hypothetical protein LTR37_017979 [Vermiconidia calcicola]
MPDITYVQGEPVAAADGSSWRFAYYCWPDISASDQGDKLEAFGGPVHVPSDAVSEELPMADQEAAFDTVKWTALGKPLVERAYEPTATTPKKTPGKARVTKKRKREEGEEGEDAYDGSQLQQQRGRAANNSDVAAKKTKTKKKTKKTEVEEEDEEDEDMYDFEDDEEEFVPAPSARKKKGKK